MKSVTDPDRFYPNTLRSQYKPVPGATPGSPGTVRFLVTFRTDGEFIDF